VAIVHEHPDLGRRVHGQTIGRLDEEFAKSACSFDPAVYR
jgi:hypothetical protein